MNVKRKLDKSFFFKGLKMKKNLLNISYRNFSCCSKRVFHKFQLVVSNWMYKESFFRALKINKKTFSCCEKKSFVTLHWKALLSFIDIAYINYYWEVCANNKFPEQNSLVFTANQYISRPKIRYMSTCPIQSKSINFVWFKEATFALHAFLTLVVPKD